MTKSLRRNFEKSFPEWDKMASRRIFRHFLQANFFMLILLINNHMVFLVQFGINLGYEAVSAVAASIISVFRKAHSRKLIPNWTRNRMITCTSTPSLQSVMSCLFRFPYIPAWFQTNTFNDNNADGEGHLLIEGCIILTTSALFSIQVL